MLPNETNDLMYLLNILESIEKIKQYTAYIYDVDTFYEYNEQLNLNASFNLLANIGEDVSRISIGLKEKYPDVEWQQIKDFRNTIVHNYMGIDIIVTFNIIKQDIEVLRQQISEIVRERIQTNVFDIEEINLCRQSKYYKHVNFTEIVEIVNSE
jgi:uncharacterized protein with HEPN domain